MIETRWIRIIPLPAPPRMKTRPWRVETLAEAPLGTIRWLPWWRRYCFFPEGGASFDAECLTDLALFCEERTLEQKRTWKKAKEA